MDNTNGEVKTSRFGGQQQQNTQPAAADPLAVALASAEAQGASSNKPPVLDALLSGTNETVLVGAQASLSMQAASTLEQLKNPVEGILRGDTAYTAGTDIPGWYTTNKPTLRYGNGQKIQAERLGGRFFYALERITDPAAKRILDTLASTGQATYVDHADS